MKLDGEHITCMDSMGGPFQKPLSVNDLFQMFDDGDRIELT